MLRDTIGRTNIKYILNILGQYVQANMPPKASPQVSRVRFTFFNYWANEGSLETVFSEEADRLLEWLERNTEYVVMGVETCPSTGKLHWQGYCTLIKKKTRLSSLMSTSIGFRWNVGTCNADNDTNIDYCSKVGKGGTGNYIEHGTRPVSEQGARNDLKAIRQLVSTSGLRGVVDSGASLNDIKYAEYVAKFLEPKRNFQPLVIYLQGPSGAGKSRFARELSNLFFPGLDPYVKNSPGKWFDGYDADPVCILDDWRDSWWTISEALNIFDQYACRIECKGGSRQFLAKVIIVTSIREFQSVYNGVKGEDSWQFRRRFSQVITLRHFDSVGVSVTCDRSLGNNKQDFSHTGVWNYPAALEKLDVYIHRHTLVDNSYAPGLVPRAPSDEVTTYYSPTKTGLLVRCDRASVAAAKAVNELYTDNLLYEYERNVGDRIDGWEDV